LTHLSEVNSKRLLNKLLAWLNVDGIVVVSLHGRFAHKRGPSFDNYGVGDRWAGIAQGYSSESGYGYADYYGQDGYGISLSKPAWSVKLIEEFSEIRLLMLSELAWDGHHDVLALQKRDILS
ncbi:MAG: class I SAM-dependent methyltransferase, partial [Pyrinomonadaceae bacterium]